MLYAVIGVVALVMIVSVARSSGKKAEARRAAEAAAAKEQARKDEAKRQIEEDKRRMEAMQADSKRKNQEREAAIEAALDKYPDARAWRVEKIESEVHSKLLTITEFTPISKNRYVAIDLETTGLKYGEDQIVEIAAVRVENGEITAEYQQLVDPQRPMPADASAVNHITDDMLANQPKIYEVLPAFLSFIGDDVLAVHNAKFDARFIAQTCAWNRFRTPARYFDTMELARYWPEAENKKLGTLLAAAGIENDDAHRALGDACAVASLISATNERRAEKRRSSKT